MLFGRTFDNPALLGRIRRLRKNPVAGYAVALGAVTIATLVRWAVTQLVSATAPFVTYFLAIIFVALACGFWPGMVAVLLSVLAGAVLFLPPAFSFAVDPAEVWALLLFAVVASINVALTSGLIAGLLIEDERQKFLIQELRHRSQNLFAIIQTIVSRSFVAGQTSSQAKEALEGRLAALARTHAMPDRDEPRHPVHLSRLHVPTPQGGRQVWPRLCELLAGRQPRRPQSDAADNPGMAGPTEERQELADLSAMLGPILRGWQQYYGHFHSSALKSVWRRVNRSLIGWLMRKHKKLAGHKTRAAETLKRLAQRQPGALVHWSMGYLS